MIRSSGVPKALIKQFNSSETFYYITSLVCVCTFQGAKDFSDCLKLHRQKTVFMSELYESLTAKNSVIQCAVTELEHSDFLYLIQY